jgi:hypothetical protein
MCLSDIHTGGDLKAMLQLLTPKEQSDDTDRDVIQEE